MQSVAGCAREGGQRAAGVCERNVIDQDTELQLQLSYSRAYIREDDTCPMESQEIASFSLN